MNINIHPGALYTERVLYINDIRTGTLYNRFLLLRKCIQFSVTTQFIRSISNGDVSGSLFVKSYPLGRRIVCECKN